MERYVIYENLRMVSIEHHKASFLNSRGWVDYTLFTYSKGEIFIRVLVYIDYLCHMFYLTITRRNLCYFMHILSKFRQNLHQGHWDVAMRVPKYEHTSHSFTTMSFTLIGLNARRVVILSMDTL